MSVKPTTAMVLAAGLGTRMRPLTDHRPKPLVEVAGKALLDHVLDKVAAEGVARAVVNVHYLADQIERHVATRVRPTIVISDERGMILGTGGGVARALARIGAEPFFHLNADTLWIDGPRSNLSRLAEAFDPARMDCLLLLAPTVGSIGYAGPGDFGMDGDGRLARREASGRAPYVFAGAAILAPALFANAPEGEFALTVLFDRAAAAGRLFGLPLDGVWMHVGTVEAISRAEAAIAEHRR
jgi:MurNAc alpha-1-phosphate uridylyltransferase